MAFAASCAAFFSKARNEGKVPVAKAAVSDLSKPAGAVPGKAGPSLSHALHCLMGCVKNTILGGGHQNENAACQFG